MKTIQTIKVTSKSKTNLKIKKFDHSHSFFKIDCNGQTYIYRPGLSLSQKIATHYTTKQMVKSRFPVVFVDCGNTQTQTPKVKIMLWWFLCGSLDKFSEQFYWPSGSCTLSSSLHTSIMRPPVRWEVYWGRGEGLLFRGWGECFAVPGECQVSHVFKPWFSLCINVGATSLQLDHDVAENRKLNSSQSFSV